MINSTEEVTGGFEAGVSAALLLELVEVLFGQVPRPIQTSAALAVDWVEYAFGSLVWFGP